MDLRSIKLRLADRHARAIVADARGERPADLEGERFERVASAAAPLVAAVAERAGGTVRALSIDAVDRVIRASLVGAAASPGVSFVGPAYDELTVALPPLARAALGEIRPRVADPPGDVSEAAFWQALYAGGGDGWELGRPSPPLERHFRAHPPRGRRALVVGCGRGHEARLLARLGAERVVALDIAEAAIAEARAIDGSERVEWRVGDLFHAPRAADRYDLVVEHCCFCAIDPRRRGEYASAIADVLAEGGLLVGLFWAHGREGGPPFSVSRDELLRTFADRFTVEGLDPARDSVAARQGQELLARFRRR